MISFNQFCSFSGFSAPSTGPTAGAPERPLGPDAIDRRAFLGVARCVFKLRALAWIATVLGPNLDLSESLEGAAPACLAAWTNGCPLAPLTVDRRWGSGGC